jgi:hypothetical protein
MSFCCRMRLQICRAQSGDGLDGLKRRRLQALCKRKGIWANQSNASMIRALRALASSEWWHVPEEEWSVPHAARPLLLQAAA